MSVLLLGVAADTTNCRPTPRVYDDGRFEYIPIPDAMGPDGTIEERTFGSTDLRHRSGTFADYIDRIKPGGEYTEWISGLEMADWPLHCDPNFEALTYGESSGRPAYMKDMRSLESGDLVAFYTGLRDSESSARHRYLIGYMSVNEVVDLQQISYQGDILTFSDLPVLEQQQLMERHAANAHAKRYLATDRLKADDDGVIIVDGCEPGGRLERAIPISEQRDNGHHYLSSEAASMLPGHHTAGDLYFGGRKPSHLLDVAAGEFVRFLERAEGREQMV